MDYYVLNICLIDVFWSMSLEIETTLNKIYNLLIKSMVWFTVSGPIYL